MAVCSSKWALTVLRHLGTGTVSQDTTHAKNGGPMAQTWFQLSTQSLTQKFLSNPADHHWHNHVWENVIVNNSHYDLELFVMQNYYNKTNAQGLVLYHQTFFTYIYVAISEELGHSWGCELKYISLYIYFLIFNLKKF